jgi:hypothetical protein
MAVDLGAARESERRVAVRAIKQKHRARQRPARPQSSEKSVPVRAGVGALHSRLAVLPEASGASCALRAVQHLSGRDGGSWVAGRTLLIVIAGPALAARRLVLVHVGCRTPAVASTICSAK